MIRRMHLLALRVYRRLPVQARRRVVRTIAPGYTVGNSRTSLVRLILVTTVTSSIPSSTLASGQIRIPPP